MLASKNVTIVNKIEQEDLSFICRMYKYNTFTEYCELLGHGNNAKVYGYKQYAIKVFSEYGYEEKNDAFFLQALQGHECIPMLYFFIPESMLVCHIVDGVTVWDTEDSDIVPCDQWVDKLSDFIDFAYNKGIVPEDLTPHNVMFDLNGQPRLIDVGAFTVMSSSFEKDKHNSLMRRYLDILEDICRHSKQTA
jgi:serine/threonine protein kinase